MILEHELMAAAANLVEHSPGIVSSVVGVVIYALIRDGLPKYKRWRNGGHNPGNPGNHLLAERILGCETAIVAVKESCARTDERWIAQEKFNNRMEKHVENFYKRLEK